MAKTAYKAVQKNPHLHIISEEIFLVNKIENAVNTGLAFCFVNSVAKGKSHIFNASGMVYRMPFSAS